MRDFSHHSQQSVPGLRRGFARHETHVGCLLLATVFIFLISHPLGQGDATAEPQEEGILLDGIAVLAGGKTWNESDSIPILLSDVDFEAALIMVRERGPIQTHSSVPESVRVRARRWAVVVRLLAKQAGQFKETTNPRDVAALRKELIKRAGGPEAMQQLITQFGVDDTALTQWIENALLAAAQVRYIIEQVDVPSPEMEESVSNGKQQTEDGYIKTQRRMILKERTAQTMKKWLESILAVDEVRIIQ